MSKSYRKSPIAVINLAKLADLRDAIARDMAGKQRKREVLDRAEQMEFKWAREALRTPVLRGRR